LTTKDFQKPVRGKIPHFPLRIPPWLQPFVGGLSAHAHGRLPKTCLRPQRRTTQRTYRPVRVVRCSFLARTV